MAAVGADRLLKADQSYIIKRPRLTRLLDEADTRIIMLVAPAGYGKTTLMREWLAEQPHGWYRGTTATSDVAELAVGLARASAIIVTGAGERMGQRLRATGTPEQDVVPLAEMLAEDLEHWPDDAWLAFDDYHFACESPFAERFVDLLLLLCPVKLILATRTRPTWATSRRLLYGEMYELSRSLLAMSQDEASQVLSHRSGNEARGLVALADGWPAVIGLAAHADDLAVPESDIPETLYRYFAEELYQTADAEVQDGLLRLALASSVPPRLAESLLGSAAEHVISEGLRLGFLTTSNQSCYDIHPLLRGFLDEKLRERGDEATAVVIPPLVDTFIDQARWDDCFALVERYFETAMFTKLLGAALPDLLHEARLPTLARWLECASGHKVDSPVVDLAEAELAFREGDRERSEALALHAARRSHDDAHQTCRALCVAGRSAHLAYRDEVSLEYYSEAESVALTDEDREAVLWGQLLAADALQTENVVDLLTKLRACSSHSADSVMRLANAELLSYTSIPLLNALDTAERVHPLASRVRDPMIISSFLNGYGVKLSLAARYRDAIEVSNEELELAKTLRLAFALPYAYVSRAAAEWGLRRFQATRSALVRAHHLASDDGFVALSIGSITVKLHLALGEIDKALSALRGHYHRRAPLGMKAEHLAWSSLALACAERPREAERSAQKAESISTRPEVTPVTHWSRAITAVRTRRFAAADLVATGLHHSTTTGNYDALVAAYRSYPSLLRVLRDVDHDPDIVSQIISAAHDTFLAKRFGLSIGEPVIPVGTDLLTNRERDVLDLVRQGKSNKAIAKSLYITEGTVKVHMRRIFHKLGAHTRTEAALIATQTER